jgi:hypothetical protein
MITILNFLAHFVSIFKIDSLFGQEFHSCLSPVGTAASSARVQHVLQIPSTAAFLWYKMQKASLHDSNV